MLEVASLSCDTFLSGVSAISGTYQIWPGAPLDKTTSCFRCYSSSAQESRRLSACLPTTGFKAILGQRRCMLRSSSSSVASRMSQRTACIAEHRSTRLSNGSGDAQFSCYSLPRVLALPEALQILNQSPTRHSPSNPAQVIEKTKPSGAQQGSASICSWQPLQASLPSTCRNFPGIRWLASIQQNKSVVDAVPRDHR